MAEADAAMKEDDDDPIATMARTAAAAANAQDGNDGNHSKKRRGSTLAAIVSSNATEKLTATQQFNKMYVYKSKKVIDLSVLDTTFTILVVIIVMVIFFNAFLFCCLATSYTFQTNPNSVYKKIQTLKCSRLCHYTSL